MKAEFMVERDGKKFALYQGLLDEAHGRGLKSIVTTLVQVPNELNGSVAIVHATVETEQGTFTGLGDASPTNVTRMMAPHLIRMAETRAKARALRDAVNVGATSLEELAEDGSGADDEPEEPRRSAPVARGGDLAPRRIGQNPDNPPAYSGPTPAAGNQERRPIPPVDREHGGEGEMPAGERAKSINPATAGTPATPKQIETIERMARAGNKSVDTDGLTRQQASEIISSLIGEMGERRAS